MSDIQLVTLEGFARKSGTDVDGLVWIEYTKEEADFCDDGEGCNTDGMEGSCLGHGDYCEECNAEIFSGWVCLDGGEVVCSEHVKYPCVTT